MKRYSSKDDLFTRPTINFSPAEQSGQDQMSTPSSRHRLAKYDAVAYLKQVKDTFQDSKEKYSHLLEILKDFQAQRVDTAGVVLRVKDLFDGHRHLILGFSTFLPEGYEITLPVEDEPLQIKKEVEVFSVEDEPLQRKTEVEFFSAINFLRKIKTRFEDNENVCSDFQDIMQFFRKGDMSVAEAMQEVSVLLHGHTDLLENFMHFLPDTMVAEYVRYNQLGRGYRLRHDSGVSPTINARSMSAARNIHHLDSDQWDCIEKENEKREDCDRNDWERDGMQDLVSSFYEKVKEKLQDPQTSEKISDCLRSYIGKIFTLSEFQMLVATLLGNHADLMKECKNFLYYVEKTALLAEIKEMNKKNQNEDDMVLSIGAGYRQPIRSLMVFEYSDPEIHGDLYQVMKHSRGEICTPEHHDKIMTIWTTFFEAFLGVPSLPRSALDTDYVKDNDHVTKRDSSLGEGSGCPADESSSGNCESLDVLEHEDRSIPTEISLSQMVNDNNGIRSDGSPYADQVAYESDVKTQVHIGVLDQDLQPNIEVGLFVEPFPTASGPYVANADCGIETMPIIESQTAKPFMVKIPMTCEGEDKNSQIFYGNDSFYLLFRFHQILYERMCLAKMLSSSSEEKDRILNDSIPTDPYARFKDALCSLLNGSSDNSKFEDECRAIFGAEMYVLFTLDKLIHKLIKQTIVTEEMDNKLLQLCAYERLRNPDKFSDVVYHWNARVLLPYDNLYRIECFPSTTLLTIQLMRNDHGNVEVSAASINPDFVPNLNDVFLSVPPERRKKPGVFLQRNKTKCTLGDEINDIHRSMEGLIVYNGLIINVNCDMKLSYIRCSEDFMFRTRGRRKALYQKSLCNGASNGNCHKRERKLRFSR
ncbi:paired amphipathic helix protein Sin3-like 4 isoform X2 [Henckelia pumila]|uniref:paired amphipathic helix protein Sin3-like 4 isoform X2 n=1 Tax=Henckelia pumila TaxID=405737 RepID=UPI003C6DFE30